MNSSDAVDSVWRGNGCGSTGCGPSAADGSFAARTVFFQPTAAPAAKPARNVARRRSISPEAGRALEMLGHAIEYLTDEFLHAGGFPSARDPQVEAVQLLMALNREVYQACPERPSLASRFYSIVRPRAALAHRQLL